MQLDITESTEFRRSEKLLVKSCQSCIFPCVTRDAADIYLCKGDQGHTGSWVWIGVEDAEKLYEELKASGARIRQEPTNYPWALEMRVEDVDGNV